MVNFWKELQKPFLVLAPMEDVTDVVFRDIVADTASPDVFFTEFTSSDGLATRGRDETIKKLKYTAKQRPIVAQVWGTEPSRMFEASKLVKELGFDGVDINMGCPDKAVVKKGAGAAHCTNLTLAKEIIDAVKEGAGDIAVSVKTRLGLNKNIADGWIPFLLEQELAALTIHGRLAIHKSDVPADWEQIGKAVAYRNIISPETQLIGNGDINSYAMAMEMYEMYKVDGIMIGRGVFSNPWIFEKNISPTERTPNDNIELMMKHVTLFSETWGKTKNFEIMKKFFKMYVREFDGASQLRQKLMECKTPEEVENVIINYENI